MASDVRVCPGRTVGRPGGRAPKQNEGRQLAAIEDSTRWPGPCTRCLVLSRLRPLVVLVAFFMTEPRTASAGDSAPLTVNVNVVRSCIVTVAGRPQTTAPLVSLRCGRMTYLAAPLITAERSSSAPTVMVDEVRPTVVTINF